MRTRCLAMHPFRVVGKASPVKLNGPVVDVRSSKVNSQSKTPAQDGELQLLRQKSLSHQGFPANVDVPPLTEWGGVIYTLLGRCLGRHALRTRL